MRQVVDLDNDAIDAAGQCVPLIAHLSNKIQNGFYIAGNSIRLNYFTTQAFAKDFCIYYITVFSDNVHHIDGYNYRNTQLHKLSCKIKITLKVCSVNNVENCIIPSMVKLAEYPDIALDDVWRTTLPMDGSYNGTRAGKVFRRGLT